MTRRLSLLRNGVPIPDQVRASEAQLAGSVHYLYRFVVKTLNLTAAQADLIQPGFETLNLAIGDRLEDWNRVFLHVLDELREKGVQLEQREAVLERMRLDGRTLLYRREVGEERILTTLQEEHRGNGFGIEMADHNGFKLYNDRHGHALGDLVLGTTGRLFRMHREGDIGVRWGGDEYLRILPNLAGPEQLALVAGRDAELVKNFHWSALDERLRDQPPSLTIGLVYCERPSREESRRMKALDERVELVPHERFDPAVPVPPGSSYDLARALVELADAEMYRAKYFPPGRGPRISQLNMRIEGGRLNQMT